METSSVCEICGAEDSGNGKSLCYDHNHENDKFRGILCSKCNIGIGLLGDTIEDLKNALKYLEEKDGS